MSTPSSTKPKAKQRKPLPTWLKLWANYHVAFWTLVVLLYITWRGTLYQEHHGINEAQHRYFTSWFLFDEPLWPGPAQEGENLSSWQQLKNTLRRIIVPFPIFGGIFWMAVLTLNLLGGVVRIFWQWNLNKIGALGGHLGVLLLMAAAIVSHQQKREGYLALNEGEQSSVVQSYNLPVIQIRSEKAGKLQSQSLETTPQQLRAAIKRSQRRGHNPEGEPVLTVADPSLPFTVRVQAAISNHVPTRTESILERTPVIGPVDGVVLAIEEQDPQSERNAAAAHVTIHDNDGKQIDELLLSQLSTQPASIQIDDQSYWIDIRQKSWQMPFTVRLDEASSTYYPGTSIPATFESYVSKINENSETKHEIYMNHPLRTEGYAIFQAKMSNDSLGSTFEVVDNPSDQWPEIACWIIAASLLVHFLISLIKGLTRRSKPAN